MSELLLYGVIGDPFDKLEAKTVVPLIRAASGPLSVRINSPGGLVMDGLAIVEALRSYPGKVTIYVDGLAASMASVIAMTGAETIMAEASLMMIHKPWDASIGNADELRKDAAKLDRIEQQLIGIYSKRTGLPDDQLASMLAAETWLTADEALELGFATSISASLQLAAMADVSACGFRHTPDRLKGSTMNAITTPAPSPSPDTSQAAIERTRVITIMNLCDKHGLPTTVKMQLIDNGTELGRAREVILDQLAARDDAMNIGHSRGNSGTFDNPDFHGKAVGDAIYARLSGTTPEGAARELMGVTMVDLAREMLDKQGVRNAIRMRPHDVFHPSNWRQPGPRNAITTTTSDFPSLLQGAGERFLLDRYAAAASVLKQVARVRSVPDFREISGVALSGFGTLETVNEAGEFKNGTFNDRTERYRISTFGKMFNLSRQALINDDLGAFGDVLTIMGRAAAETEAVFLAALLTANPNMADGNPVFSAQHGNLASPAGPIAAATLSDARFAMRSQKDLDKTTPLNITPRYLVTGAAKETEAEMALASINPAATGDVNPFAGKLALLVDPRIAGNAWYLFGDPTTSPPVLETAYLNGVTEPFLDTQDGWRVDGTEYKVRHDFGAGFVDWKGAWKNTGA